jgi:hypothetical protein
MVLYLGHESLDLDKKLVRDKHASLPQKRVSYAAKRFTTLTLVPPPSHQKKIVRLVDVVSYNFIKLKPGVKSYNPFSSC